MNDLNRKVVLVTGSSEGIGFSIAKAFSENGCKVVLNGRNRKKLIIAQKKIKDSVFVVGDVTKPIKAKKIIEKIIKIFGNLDILICNVGNGESVRPGMESPKEWQRMFAANFWSTTNMVEAAYKSLLNSKGSIVCISSICGIEVINNAPLTYSAAKAALNSYVRGMARHFGNQGVRINAIALGNILFDGSSWSKKILKNEENIKKMISNEVPLNCFGSPEDAAGLAVFLASNSSKFVTGSIWNLDGEQVRS